MTDELTAFLNLTIYQTYAYYNRHGVGSYDPETSLDAAADDYVDAREDGRPAVVLEINLRDGTAKDVTKAAEARIAEWLLKRGDDLPDWMDAA